MKIHDYENNSKIKRIQTLDTWGHPKHKLENCSNSKYETSRIAVALYTMHLPTLTKLSEDKSPIVRSAVAARQNTRHLDKLQHDPNPIVRQHVAYFGSPRHADRLSKDTDPNVAKTARKSVKYYKQDKSAAESWKSADPDEIPSYGIAF